MSNPFMKIIDDNITVIDGSTALLLMIQTGLVADYYPVDGEEGVMRIVTDCSDGHITKSSDSIYDLLLACENAGVNGSITILSQYFNCLDSVIKTYITIVTYKDGIKDTESIATYSNISNISPSVHYLRKYLKLNKELLGIDVISGDRIIEKR